MTLGTLAVVVMSVFLAYAAARAAYSLSEYFLARSLVQRIAASAPATDVEVREAFDRQRGVDGIESLQGSDLVIRRQGRQIAIAFSYDKVVPLVGPVSLLIEYRGSSSGS